MRWLVAVLLLVPAAAQARAQSDLPYAVGEAFSTAVRFVRVDRGCKVIDKDADAAFVAFECSDEGKVRRGSLELFKIATQGPQREMVRAQVTLGDDTHGMELRWLELFERKLREERGTPTPPPSAPTALPSGNKKDGGV
jgi:hypothetical protein